MGVRPSRSGDAAARRGSARSTGRLPPGCTSVLGAMFAAVVFFKQRRVDVDLPDVFGASVGATSSRSAWARGPVSAFLFTLAVLIAEPLWVTHTVWNLPAAAIEQPVVALPEAPLDLNEDFVISEVLTVTKNGVWWRGSPVGSRVMLNHPEEIVRIVRASVALHERSGEDSTVLLSVRAEANTPVAPLLRLAVALNTQAGYYRICLHYHMRPSDLREPWPLSRGYWRRERIELQTCLVVWGTNTSLRTQPIVLIDDGAMLDAELPNGVVQPLDDNARVPTAAMLAALEAGASVGFLPDERTTVGRLLDVVAAWRSGGSDRQITVISPPSDWLDR
jgi:hypothetical protein